MPLKDPEKNKEKARLYYEKNKEKINERNRLYYEKNKEIINERQRLYNEKNKERIKEYDRLYNEKNKERIKERERLYNQTEKGIKSRRIKNWKHSGVVCHDFEELYKTYMNISFCDFCKVELTYDKTTTATTKCLDHDHVSGEFRNILCHSCNVKRR